MSEKNMDSNKMVAAKEQAESESEKSALDEFSVQKIEKRPKEEIRSR